MRFPVRIGLLLLAGALLGCSPRANLTPRPVPEGVGDDVTVYMGTTRARTPEGPWSANQRGPLTFARIEVSVPPQHRPGHVELPDGATPDPQTDFVTREVRSFVDGAAFRGAIRGRLRGGGRAAGEVIVTVHGFNNTIGDGVYRTAQMVHDLGIAGPAVHYSWSSLGKPLGYAADRDSALFARDGLEQLLGELGRAGAGRIVLVAHSMGSHLTMETLRQIAIRGDHAMMDRIAGVVLMAPDIDIGLFRRQAEAIGQLPQPFVIFTSQRDPALSLSARLTWQPNRLGNIQGIDALKGLEVIVVDLTEARDVDMRHQAALSSPSVLRFMEQAADVRRAMQTDQTGRTGLVPGTMLIAQEATAVMLAPIAVIEQASD